MRFFAPALPDYTIGRKTGCNLLSHLKTFRADTWPDKRMNFFPVGAKAHHGVDCFCNDAANSPSPARMSRTDNPGYIVGEKHRHAIGC